MGMYDIVSIDLDQLPLTDKEKDAMKGKYIEWQTKDFERLLDVINIDTDGFLTATETIKGLYYTGSFNFYTSFGPDFGASWIEFVAHFTDGKLDSIERYTRKF